MPQPAFLVLADGQIFEGFSYGASGQTSGELVFNTAMTGYQEIFTDPSYTNQIVMLTASHIGNTGCNTEDKESFRPHIKGLVIREGAEEVEHFRNEISLPRWLKQHGIVAISGVDTRTLTLILREKGSMGVCITTDANDLKAAHKIATGATGSASGELASLVSCKTQQSWDEGEGKWAQESQALRFHVVAYDFGIKQTMLKILVDLGCYVTLLPAKSSAEEALALKPDGIFLSNGPGDPFACTEAIQATKVFLEEKIPVFGICLGFQILGLALGAKSYKMKFGHHGANHPVLAIETKDVMITSQNHGFAIDETSLQEAVLVTHRSLFDGSLQGIRHLSLPVFGFQGHPEASPGPHDARKLFGYFIELMEKWR